MRLSSLFSFHSVCIDSRAHASSLGLFLGSFSWGYLSDVYGRKPVLRVLCVSTFALSIASAFASSFVSLLVLRTLVGAALGGFGVAFGYFLEWIPSKQRGSYSILLMTAWTFGIALEATLGWYCLAPPKSDGSSESSTPLDWKILIILSSLPLIVPTIGVFAFVPESPRWLVSRGRYAEAKDALAYAERMNNASMRSVRVAISVNEPSDQGDETELVSQSDLDQSDLARVEGSTVASIGTTKFAAFTSVVFSPPHKRTFMLMWGVWFFNSFVYYGIVLLTSSLGSSTRDFACVAYDPSNADSKTTPFRDDDFHDIFVATFAELPGVAFALVGVQTFGRRKTQSTSFFLCFVCLLGMVLDPNHHVAFVWVARAFVNSAFVVSWLFTQELFPSAIRSSAFGVCNAFSRFGGMLTPFVAQTMLNERGLVPVVATYAAASAAAFALSVAVKRETSSGSIETTVS